ncbi:MAG: DUF1080 domain-containing protein [Bacteroidota bacterium]
MASRTLLLAGLLASGCANWIGGADGADGATPSRDAPEADWIVLFDGETLDGWTGYNRDDAPAGWSVEDGAIRFTPGVEGGDLMVEGTYDDFELELEWKVAECGNSGIFYRGEVSPAFDVPWRTALEMQVLDDACHPDARYPSHRAGALYDLYVPTDLEAVRPAGTWNHTRIVADGPRIEHWLNGIQIVAAEQGSADWEARVAASKFRDGDAFPAFGTRLGGGIGVQDHGDSVWYRNVRIRRL